MKWARFCYTQKAKHLSQQQVKNFALSDSPRRSALPYGGIFDTPGRKNEDDVDGYNYRTKRVGFGKQFKPKTLGA